MKLIAAPSLAAIALSLSGLCASFAESVPVTVTVNPTVIESPARPGFEGLSFETGIIVPNYQGGHCFDPKDAALVQLFRTLGVGSLRIGGATVDDLKVNPSNADIDSLFAFAKAAGVKVIYSFRLRNADAASIEASVRQAVYIMEHYHAFLDCFAIGNEPSMYSSSYDNYQQAWLAFYKILIAACPTAKVCGPGDWRESYAVSFTKQFAAYPNIACITQHEYPFGPSTSNTNAAIDVGMMLGSNTSRYSGLYNRFVPTVLDKNLSYRIEETNSFTIGGVAGVSNGYPASLWSLDYLYWWWAHQAAGVNFHTGAHGPNSSKVARYSAFTSSTNGRQALPLAYGMLAFNIASQGRLVEANTKIPSDVSPPFHLTAYAVMAPGQTAYVTVFWFSGNVPFGVRN